MDPAAAGRRFPRPYARRMIDIEDVLTAAARLDGVAHRTPVLRSRTLDAWTGGEVLLKAEHLQRMGAFKFRGAYNALAALDDDVLARGVCAYSSGNHAQAVALSARILSTRATIVMPADTPVAKLDATRGYGADVVLYDRYTEDRAAITASLADEHGMTIVPPFDDDHVMAGQGTAALELIEDTADGGPLDVLVVCVGGGGLISGCATVARALSPSTRVIGVEPASRDVARASLASGDLVVAPVPTTIADGQQGDRLGPRTLEVMRERVDEVVGVTDDEIRAAMRVLFDRMKQVVEPSGASALAAVLSGAVDARGRRVGVTLSGGNVGLERFVALMQDAPHPRMGSGAADGH
jgi:threo-3-hydroxy-L-aspartate ammonia-lyase